MAARVFFLKLQMHYDISLHLFIALKMKFKSVLSSPVSSRSLSTSNYFQWYWINLFFPEISMTSVRSMALCIMFLLSKYSSTLMFVLHLANSSTFCGSQLIHHCQWKALSAKIRLNSVAYWVLLQHHAVPAIRGFITPLSLTCLLTRVPIQVLSFLKFVYPYIP